MSSLSFFISNFSKLVAELPPSKFISETEFWPREPISRALLKNGAAAALLFEVYSEAEGAHSDGVIICCYYLG
jgi:hypothetical protein